MVGALWSNFPLGEGVLDGERVSVVLAFRVSGRAAAEARGEGLALWLSASPFRRGPSFGSTEKFSGVGVLFDPRLNKVRAVASDRLPDDPADFEESHVAAECDAASRVQETSLQLHFNMTLYESMRAIFVSRSRELVQR